LGDDWRVDSDWRPTPVLYPYWPGPGLFAARLTWSYWKRFVLPKTHEGCVSPVPRREVSSLPSEPLMPYEAGPGDCVPKSDLLCSSDTKTFSTCCRPAEPKPNFGCDRMELEVC